ncbi:AAA family ATPase [Microvirga calopogonii]|uniref:AAA family ATPase n=1 Tax=Microvirga calopogonii TaxID=2078013 RepID=UPI0013B46BF1|nr:AAA family ATPase [Microvirga calopogonii]
MQPGAATVETTSFNDFMDLASKTAPRRGSSSLSHQTSLSPTQLIARAAVKAALSRAALRGLRDRRAIVIVLQVPSAAWVEPVQDAIANLAVGRVEVIGAAYREKSTSDNREDSALHAMSLGRPVIGIAPSMAFLPQVLVAAADHTLAIPPLSPALVGQVIAKWCGVRRPPLVRAEHLAGLDLRDVAAVLRCAGTTTSPRAYLARLKRAARHRVGPPEAETLPPLADLTGYDEAKVWAEMLVADIARVRAGDLDPRELEGALFWGKPGTGKTLLARVLSAEAGVPFRATSVAMWFGNSPGYLNDIIKQIDQFCDGLLMAARSSSARTAVGFVDELDALPNRAKLSDRNSDFFSVVVTHCLMRWEELRRAGIVLIAATNHPENIDPALLRPGRFDRQFEITPPDEQGRLGILRQHLGPDLAAVDVTPAARLSSGATGAMLAGSVKAARRRARSSGRPMSLDDLLSEIAPPDARHPDEIRAVAIHEAAHAIVAHRLGLAVVQVTVQPAGDAAGATRLRLLTGVPGRQDLERRALALLSGRAADSLLGRGANAGASHDLQEATRIVTSLHASLGLGATLAHRIEPAEAERLLQWDREVTTLVEQDLQHLMRQAEAVVWANREAILATAELLVVHRVLVGDEVAAVAAAHPPRVRVKAVRRQHPAMPSPAEAGCSPACRQ